MSETQKKNKVRLREIAALAKVSVATVSRVLSGNKRVDSDHSEGSFSKLRKS